MTLPILPGHVDPTGGYGPDFSGISGTLRGGAPTIDFTGVPQFARHLRFFCKVRSDSTAGGGPVQWSMILHNDTSGNYSSQALILGSAQSAPAQANTSGASSIPLSFLSASEESVPSLGLDASSGASTFTEALIDLPYYCDPNPNVDQLVIARVGLLRGSDGGLGSMLIYGRATLAQLGPGVDRVTFQIASGNFHADSSIQLIGNSNPVE